MYPPPRKRESALREYFNGALLNFSNRRYEYANTNRGNARLVFMRNINCTTCLRSCSKEGIILKLSTYRLQIFLVKYEYLRSLSEYTSILCETKAYVLKNLFANMCLRSLPLKWRPGFKFESCSEMEGRFQRF